MVFLTRAEGQNTWVSIPLTGGQPLRLPRLPQPARPHPRLNTPTGGQPQATKVGDFDKMVSSHHLTGGQPLGGMAMVLSGGFAWYVSIPFTGGCSLWWFVVAIIVNGLVLSQYLPQVGSLLGGSTSGWSRTKSSSHYPHRWAASWWTVSAHVLPRPAPRLNTLTGGQPLGGWSVGCLPYGAGLSSHTSQGSLCMIEGTFSTEHLHPHFHRWALVEVMCPIHEASSRSLSLTGGQPLGGGIQPCWQAG